MSSYGSRAHRTLPLLGLLLAFLLAVLPSSRPAQSEEWIPVAPGVDYRLYSLRGPIRVHVARLSQSSRDVIVESSIASGELSTGFETVSGMARRYDGSLIAWGGEWGPRARVLVAINGSSYDSETGQPYGGMFQSGWYAKEYGSLAGGTGFVWTTEGVGVLRGCVNHEDGRQVVTRLATGDRFDLGPINLERRDDGLILFTPQFGASTPQGEREIEAVLRVDKPMGIVPLPRSATGTVVEVRDGHGGTPLLFDQVVLAGQGTYAENFLRVLQPGEPLGLSREITDLGFGCRSEGSFDWTDAYAGIGGGFVFLRDGEVQSSDEVGAFVHDPRTAVCLNDEFVYFVVVDGRQDSVSVGMTLDNMAAFCRDELAARWGLNQDGGGSSAMWVDGAIVNLPSDGRERGVANGLMMVAVEPALRSGRFAEGFDVTVQASGEVRTGPGPSFPVLQTTAPGETVRIAQTASSLLGVFTDGSYWWKTEVAGELGFLPEQSLVSPSGALAWFRLPPPLLAVAKR